MTVKQTEVKHRVFLEKFKRFVKAEGVRFDRGASEIA
jgi:hypothetical protein